MNAPYSITAPTGLGDIMPEQEVTLKSFEATGQTVSDCDLKAKKLFEEFMRKPENAWDYLRLIKKEQSGNYKTIDHTGWPIT